MASVHNKSHRLENYIYSVVKKLLENFNWEQFSSPSDPNDSSSAIFGAIKAMQSDPEGSNILKKQKQDEAQSFSDILAANKEQLKAKAINVSNLHKLGEGAGGIAYSIDDKTVLKVTTDSHEAMASNSLKGKALKGLINIYDVWQFPNSNFYGITMEKIIPFKEWPNSSIKENIEEIVDTFGLKQLLQKNKSDWNKSWEDISNSPLFSMSGDPKELRKAFLTLAVVEASLKTSGISKFTDLHTGNLGKRLNGEIIVFDIGLATGGTKPPMLGGNVQS